MSEPDFLPELKLNCEWQVISRRERVYHNLLADVLEELGYDVEYEPRWGRHNRPDLVTVTDHRVVIWEVKAPYANATVIPQIRRYMDIAADLWPSKRPMGIVAAPRFLTYRGDWSGLVLAPLRLVPA